MWSGDFPDNESERRVWAGCLLTSLRDLVGKLPGVHKERHQDVILEVREWFASDEWAVGSFVFICELFDLEPRSVRKVIASDSVETLVKQINRHVG